MTTYLQFGRSPGPFQTVKAERITTRAGAKVVFEGKEYPVMVMRKASGTKEFALIDRERVAVQTLDA